MQLYAPTQIKMYEEEKSHIVEIKKQIHLAIRGIKYVHPGESYEYACIECYRVPSTSIISLCNRHKNIHTNNLVPMDFKTFINFTQDKNCLRYHPKLNCIPHKVNTPFDGDYERQHRELMQQLIPEIMGVKYVLTIPEHDYEYCYNCYAYGDDEEEKVCINCVDDVRDGNGFMEAMTFNQYIDYIDIISYKSFFTFERPGITNSSMVHITDYGNHPVRRYVNFDKPYYESEDYTVWNPLENTFCYEE
jgi:hypothetical protein